MYTNDLHLDYVSDLLLYPKAASTGILYWAREGKSLLCRVGVQTANLCIILQLGEQS